MSLTDWEFADELLKVVDQYKPIDGIRIYVQQPRKIVELVVMYVYPTGLIPYKEIIPEFWKEMSPEFINKNLHTKIRYLIKTSMSVEIERLFGYTGGSFNPL